MWLATISDIGHAEKRQIFSERSRVMSDQNEAGDPSASHWSLGIFASEKFPQASASIRLSRSFLLVMPVTWSRSWPFLKKSSEGMARMLNFDERLWFSSTFTFPTFIAPAFSLAISSSNGAINLHGPHHWAQKSTRTGLSLRVTSRSKFDSSKLIAPEFSIRKCSSRFG